MKLKSIAAKHFENKSTKRNHKTHRSFHHINCGLGLFVFSSFFVAVARSLSNRIRYFIPISSSLFSRFTVWLRIHFHNSNLRVVFSFLFRTWENPQKNEESLWLLHVFCSFKQKRKIESKFLLLNHFLWVIFSSRFETVCFRWNGGWCERERERETRECLHAFHCLLILLLCLVCLCVR